MAGSHIATFPVAQFGKSARSRGLARQDRTSSRGGSSSVLAPAPVWGEGLGQAFEGTFAPSPSDRGRKQVPRLRTRKLDQLQSTIKRLR